MADYGCASAGDSSGSALSAQPTRRSADQQPTSRCCSVSTAIQQCCSTAAMHSEPEPAVALLMKPRRRYATARARPDEPMSRGSDDVGAHGADGGRTTPLKREQKEHGTHSHLQQANRCARSEFAVGVSWEQPRLAHGHCSDGRSASGSEPRGARQSGHDGPFARTVQPHRELTLRRSCMLFLSPIAAQPHTALARRTHSDRTSSHGSAGVAAAGGAGTAGAFHRSA